MSGSISPPDRISLRFWGVRGSIPTTTPSNAHYGGNTSGVEIRHPTGELFIFDAGTGIRDLGLPLKEADKSHVHIFLTHFHWDHLQGIPFFAPLYQAGTEVTFHSTRPQHELHELVHGQMSSPYFPVPLQALPAKQHFEQLDSDGDRFGGLAVTPFALHHPQGATGYRIEHNGAVVVYATDHEHGDGAADRRLREFAEGADVLIYDAQFTTAEHANRRGWGHSTWQEAICVARDTHARQLVLFHHDPGRSDDQMGAVVTEARREFPNTDAAREGWTFSL